jgi:hypothetical protein
MSEQPFQMAQGGTDRVVMDEDPQLLARRYQWLLQLMRDDDERYRQAGLDPAKQKGSLRSFVKQARGQIKSSKGNVDLFRAWWRENWSKTDWFKSRDAFRRESEIQRADPTTRLDYERSLERTRTRIQALADGYGVQLSESELNDLTEESRLMQWTDAEIDQKLRPILETQIMAAEPGSLMGTAGSAETNLLNWTRQNGLELSRSDLAPYISRITTGKQSLEDAQADIRKTYLAGMYPAWADRINEGNDPSFLFAPYRNTAQRLLEVENLGLDDPVMKRAAQYVGADGKPSQLPLYEFEKEIRKDPRWQYTDNAYESYASVGTDLLRMFGFR